MVRSNFVNCKNKQIMILDIFNYITNMIQLMNPNNTTFLMISSSNKIEPMYGLQVSYDFILFDRKFGTNRRIYYLLFSNKDRLIHSMDDFKQWLKNKFRQDSKYFFLFYSGHARQHTGNLAFVTLQQPNGDNLSLQQLVKIWITSKRNQSKKLFIILDSDYSGSWCYQLADLNQPSIGIFASCRPYQMSRDTSRGGAFFNCILGDQRSFDENFEKLIFHNTPLFINNSISPRRLERQDLEIINRDIFFINNLTSYEAYQDQYILSEGKIYQGSIYFKNGDIYHGQWNNQRQPDGYGVYFYKTGEEYQGEWKNGKYNKSGSLKLLGGFYFLGKWQEGQIRQGKLSFGSYQKNIIKKSQQRDRFRSQFLYKECQYMAKQIIQRNLQINPDSSWKIKYQSQSEFKKENQKWYKSLYKQSQMMIKRRMYLNQKTTFLMIGSSNKKQQFKPIQNTRGLGLNGVRDDLQLFYNKFGKSDAYLQSSAHNKSELLKMEQIKYWLSEKFSLKSNFFVLFYAGHGHKGTGNLAIDTIEHPDGDNLSLQELVKIWRTSTRNQRQSKKLAIILDSCYSGQWCYTLARLNQPSVSIYTVRNQHQKAEQNEKGGSLFNCILGDSKDFQKNFEYLVIKHTPKFISGSRETVNLKRSDLRAINRDIFFIYNMISSEQKQDQYDSKEGQNNQGSIYYRNGDIYHGQWNNQRQPHGYGFYFYKTGEEYEGYWMNGKRHGRGSLKMRSGQTHVGNWINDNL